MTTTIQIGKKTKDALFDFIVDLEKRYRRSVSYDEAIRYIMEQVNGRKKENLLKVYGCLEKTKAIEDLKELKNLEVRKFEKLSSRIGS